MLSVAEQAKLYLCFHSYGQYFLYPWGWTDVKPDDWQALDDLARNASQKLTALYGTPYTVGTSTNLLGRVASLFLFEIIDLVSLTTFICRQGFRLQR